MSSRILCQAVLCELYRLEGDVDNTQAAARTLKSTTQDTSLVFWRALADGMMGWTELALESIERAGSLIEHYGTHLIRGAYLCQRGTALAATGQSNGAISCWQQGIVESRRLGL